MSEETTNTSEATETETVATKAPVKKATVKKAVTKTPGGKGKTVVKRKVPVKKAAKAKGSEGPGRKKKEGLRKAQIKILKVLAKSSKALNRAQIAERAEVDVAWLNSWIGSNNIEKREKNDQVFPSLLTLKMVKFGPGEDEHGTTYEITAVGKKALESAE